MNTVISIPILAVALVTASAAWNVALACVPPGPGQCCTGAVFRENGKYCQVTNCMGKGQFAPIDRQTHCWFIAQPIGTNVQIPVPHPPLGNWQSRLHTNPGSTHQ